MSGRRVVNVTIESTMFGYIVRGRADASITSDWPDDAVIVGGEFNLDRGVVRLMIESSAFDEVPSGYTIPDWTPTFTARTIEPPAQALIDLIDKFHEEELRDAADRA